MDDFANVFAAQASKSVSLSLSIFLTIVTSGLMFIIVRFEYSNHYRTLINQLVSSLFWIGIVWNLTLQPFVIYRYTFGPVDSDLLCKLNSGLRNVLPLHALLILDAILIVKCIFLFQMKNPTAMQDNFWASFQAISAVSDA